MQGGPLAASPEEKERDQLAWKKYREGKKTRTLHRGKIWGRPEAERGWRRVGPGIEITFPNDCKERKKAISFFLG